MSTKSPTRKKSAKKTAKKDWVKIQKIIKRKKAFQAKAQGDKIDWSRFDTYE